MRAHLGAFREETTKNLILSALKSKECWEELKDSMKERGIEFPESITFEQVKEFYTTNSLPNELSNFEIIQSEAHLISEILPFLQSRDWLLIKTDASNGPFITSDHPASLSWREPSKIPALLQKSPGFGLKGTRVYFPLSSSLALIGEFGAKSGVLEASMEHVSAMNSIVISHCHRQIYSPKLSFFFYGNDMKIHDGHKLLTLAKELELAVTR